MGWIGTGHVHLGRLAGAGTLEWISLERYCGVDRHGACTLG